MGCVSLTCSLRSISCTFCPSRWFSSLSSLICSSKSVSATLLSPALCPAGPAPSLRICVSCGVRQQQAQGWAVGREQVGRAAHHDSIAPSWRICVPSRGVQQDAISTRM